MIWHRRDLRLSDNELYASLSQGCRSGRTLAPLYVIDPSDFQPVPSCGAKLGATHLTAKIGPFAGRFMLECVEELRQRLRTRGSELFIREGRPRDVLPAFVRELRQAGVEGPIEVRWHDEAGSDEVREAQHVRAALLSESVTASSAWGCTLWHPDDLPKSAEEWGLKRGSRGGAGAAAPPGRAGGAAPPICWAVLSELTVQSFRRKAVKSARVRPPLPEAAVLPASPTVETGRVPCLRDLLRAVQASPVFGFQGGDVEAVVAAAEQGDRRSAHPLRGGEDSALKRLSSFIAGPAAGVSRDGGGACEVGVDSSSKLSAYLAFGCLSPREIHKAYAANPQADWLAEQLEMRDFWIFSAAAQDVALFRRDNDGSNPRALPSSHWSPYDGASWSRWATGTTGLPVVDAAMKELLTTGFTANRCRQVCVSLLVRDLMQDWRLGAELFQWLLVDHDVGSNWGNWRYFAGVGCDPKQRYYCSISQGWRYDPGAEFVKLWLPCLAVLPAKQAHAAPLPGLRPRGWPEPVVDPMAHISYGDQKLVHLSWWRPGPQDSGRSCSGRAGRRSAKGGSEKGGGSQGKGGAHHSAKASGKATRDAEDARAHKQSAGGPSPIGAQPTPSAPKGRRWAARVPRDEMVGA